MTVICVGIHTRMASNITHGRSWNPGNLILPIGCDVGVVGYYLVAANPCFNCGHNWSGCWFRCCGFARDFVENHCACDPTATVLAAVAGVDLAQGKLASIIRFDSTMTNCCNKDLTTTKTFDNIADLMFHLE
jgi:hypothetical protein